jgi:hypothetical protein
LQVTALLDGTGAVLEKHRAPFCDMPMGWNINLPIPYTPYGIGEPMKVHDVQIAINRLFSAIYNVILYNQSPQQVISKSMEAAMKKAGTSLHARPDKVIVVDDSIYLDMVQSGGVLAVQPPQVPIAWIRLWELLLREHDVLSQNSEVNQGRAPFKGASGKSIQALQSASTATMSVRGRYTEWMLEHILKLNFHSVVTYFDTEDYKRYVDKYPPVILTLMKKRMKTLRFDAKAIVTGGRGPNRQAVHAEVREDVKFGLLDRESALEELEKPDVKKIIKRLDKADAAAAEAQNQGA